MAAIGIATAVSLALLDVPLALALGILAGMLDFIPYLGPILADIPATLIAFSHDPMLALYVIAVFLLLQLLEGYLLLQSEKEGQAQRLADRAAEVRELADQLAQARRQFDHFQEASAAQRQEDKQAYEARIGRTEQEATALRAHLQDSREALAVLRSEKVHLEHISAEQLDTAKEQVRKLYETTAALTAAREMASSRQFELEMAVDRREHAHQSNARLEARVGELEGENTILKTNAAGVVPKVRGRKT